jgi:4-hydroxy-tetrahydrodipicolinate reductase
VKVAIVGYGRMGSEVESVLTERGHSVVCRIDPAPDRGDRDAVTPEALAGADCVIEFALPEGVVENARAYGEAGAAAVVGTTGWESDLEAVETIVAQSGIGYLRGANFSIGANLFFTLATYAASLFNAFDTYDLLVQEAHHARKKDSPSGTALSLAERLLGQLDRKSEIVSETLHRAIQPHEIHVSSVRGGSVPGTHTVTFDSAADSIEVTHRARNRSGFATGAVLAAEWISGRSGMYTVDDFIRTVTEG